MQSVLILILMEYSLTLLMLNFFLGIGVLILILMEYSLTQVWLYKTTDGSFVLILILMEYSLTDSC